MSDKISVLLVDEPQPGAPWLRRILKTKLILTSAGEATTARSRLARAKATPEGCAMTAHSRV